MQIRAVARIHYPRAVRVVSRVVAALSIIRGCAHVLRRTRTCDRVYLYTRSNAARRRRVSSRSTLRWRYDTRASVTFGVGPSVRPSCPPAKRTTNDEGRRATCASSSIAYLFRSLSSLTSHLRSCLSVGFFAVRDVAPSTFLVVVVADAYSHVQLRNASRRVVPTTRAYSYFMYGV